MSDSINKLFILVSNNFYDTHKHRCGNCSHATETRESYFIQPNSRADEDAELNAPYRNSFGSCFGALHRNSINNGDYVITGQIGDEFDRGFDYDNPISIRTNLSNSVNPSLYTLAQNSNSATDDNSCVNVTIKAGAPLGEVIGSIYTADDGTPLNNFLQGEEADLYFPFLNQVCAAYYAVQQGWSQEQYEQHLADNPGFDYTQITFADDFTTDVFDVEMAEEKLAQSQSTSTQTQNPDCGDTGANEEEKETGSPTGRNK